MKTRLTNLVVWFVTTALLVFADQYTKSLAVLHLKDKQPLVLLDGVFELLYSENRGAAFGMLQGKQFFFFIIGGIVLLAAIYAMFKMPGFDCKRYLWLKICVILITAGALGNMIDRIYQGYVVDFFYFSLIDFPIFNVADIYVTTATAALLFLLGFYYKDDELDLFFPGAGKKKKGESL